MGPRCSFCDATAGPFLEVGGGLPLLMCSACQSARSQGERTGPEPPLLARHNLGEAELQWTCALCDYRCFLPWWLEGHTEREHPGWVARYELVQPLPRQVLRVVYERVDGRPGG